MLRFLSQQEQPVSYTGFVNKWYVILQSPCVLSCSLSVACRLFDFGAWKSSVMGFVRLFFFVVTAKSEYLLSIFLLGLLCNGGNWIQNNDQNWPLFKRFFWNWRLVKLLVIFPQHCDVKCLLCDLLRVVLSDLWSGIEAILLHSITKFYGIRNFKVGLQWM